MDSKQKYKLKKFLQDLSSITGRHTGLVSVYIPQGYDLGKIVNHLEEEQGTAVNIKDKNNRKKVMDSLERMIRHLRLFKKTPENGLAVFAGDQSPTPSKVDIGVWSIEPPVGLNVRMYRCDSSFKLEILYDMLNATESYALIVMDNREATIGMLKGKKIEMIKQVQSSVPGKTKAGGQCLAKTTTVSLADGQFVRLDELKVDEEVYSYDFKESKIIPSKVAKVWNVVKDKCYFIKIGEVTIQASGDHVFFVADLEIPAEKLKVGDLLMNEKKEQVAIEEIRIEEGEFELVDISVEAKNFFADGFLVHNSQQRYARLREEAANEFYKIIANIVNDEFLSISKTLKGILIGGPGMTKEKFANGAHINNQLKEKIIAIEDLSYTSEVGLDELVEKCQAILANEEIIAEKKIVEEFLTMLAKEPEKAAYGDSDVKKALEFGAVNKLLVSEDSKDAEMYEEAVEKMGGEFFIVSQDTEEGVQIKSLGGVAAILRFGVGQ
jgi:peptide subunit release factor 1 (eRF1)